jgi:hypothetical protein
MNRPVGVCIAQISRNPRITSACKLYVFYYFYIVVLSVSEQNKKCPNNKKKIYNDKYKHIRDRLFDLNYDQTVLFKWIDKENAFRLICVSIQQWEYVSGHLQYHDLDKLIRMETVRYKIICHFL